MDDKVYKFYDVKSKNHKIRLLVDCTCDRCGKTVLYPITNNEKLGYNHQSWQNNPYIEAYIPENWHIFDDPIGLLCDECIKELSETILKPKLRCGRDYRPKDKDGLPIDFDRWYYCDGISGTCRVMEIVGGVLYYYFIWKSIA